MLNLEGLLLKQFVFIRSLGMYISIANFGSICSDLIYDRPL